MKTLNYFIAKPLDSLLQGNEAGATEPEEVKARVLGILRVAMRDVDAYRFSFAENGILTASFSDFKRACPFLSKSNFISKYSLVSRCRNGEIGELEVMHVSSGSTGHPTFWARSVPDELASAMRFEQIFRDSFDVVNRTTLAVVCFPLGSWVGGMFTYSCLRYLNMKNYRFTTVTPGNNPDEIIKLVSALSPLYQQTVLLGYPPFIRAVIDKGFAQQPVPVAWGTMDLKLLLAGEVFSEEWRSLISARCRISNPQKSIVSVYGTADAGVLACETELSAIIRGFLAAHPEHAKQLFGKDRIPSLMQYDPLSKFFEVTQDEGTLAFTSLPLLHTVEIASQSAVATESLIMEAAEELAMPAIRYSIGDAGGIIGFNDLLAFLRDNCGGFDPLQELQNRYHADSSSSSSEDSRQSHFRRLPFVWVFGRAFWSVSLFGANVYVENIMVGLETPEAREQVTGKFILGLTTSAPELEQQNENVKLLIRIELRGGCTAVATELEPVLAESIKTQLLRLNSEYANYVPSEFQLPVVVLYKQGDPQYFPVGVKHKYTIQ